MIDVADILKQIEHMERNTPEQIEEREKEAFRLIKEREDENIRIIEESQHENSLKHKLSMLKLEEKGRLYREAHEKYMMQVQLRIQEIRARAPKRQIYFGKVKTE